MKKYIQQRIWCEQCGRYDRRLKKAPLFTKCDHCGGEAEILHACRGRGKVEVPFITRPVHGDGKVVTAEGKGVSPWHGYKDNRRDELKMPVQPEEITELMEMFS